MTLQEVLKTRKTNKNYTGKVFDEEVIDNIIADAELSPSSFGSEPWEVLVVKNDGEGKELLKELRPLMWNQPNIENASHLFFVFYRKAANFVQGSDYVNALSTKLNNIGADGDANSSLMLSHIHTHENSVNAWSRQQTYILLSNILNSATSYGLGSTPMEGLEFHKVETLLAEKGLMDTELLGLSYAVSVGEHNGSVYERVRLNKSDKFKKFNS